MITSCTQRTEYVQASYTSTALYDGWECSKLREEYISVEEVFVQSSQTQGNFVNSDVASLKGQRVALRQSARNAGCGGHTVSEIITVEP
ncbi:MAG: hypothetical protein COB24_14215 [Hyphomicrobiales bacterium]|nr:MAG: hypothetical protein COB24_14215 [Hyphomicrobiales bacterium]